MTTVQEAVMFTADDALDWQDEGWFERALSMIARRKKEPNEPSNSQWHRSSRAASSSLAYSASRLSTRRLNLISYVATRGLSGNYTTIFWNLYEDKSVMKSPE